MLASEFNFQQDVSLLHKDKNTYVCCEEHFFHFFSKDPWTLNVPDLNSLDFCILYKFCQLMNWDRITSRPTAIGEIKQIVKKIRV